MLSERVRSFIQKHSLSVYSTPPLGQVPRVPYEQGRHSPDLTELTVLGKQTAKRSKSKKCSEREVKCYSLPKGKRIQLGPEESAAGSQVPPRPHW